MHLYPTYYNHVFRPLSPLTLTSDFLGELDPLGIGQWASLFVGVLQLQDFTHEVDDRLSFIEGCGRYYKKIKSLYSVKVSLNHPFAISITFNKNIIFSFIICIYNIFSEYYISVVLSYILSIFSQEILAK